MNKASSWSVDSGQRTRGDLYLSAASAYLPALNRASASAYARVRWLVESGL